MNQELAGSNSTIGLEPGMSGSKGKGPNNWPALSPEMDLVSVETVIMLFVPQVVFWMDYRNSELFVSLHCMLHFTALTHNNFIFKHDYV